MRRYLGAKPPISIVDAQWFTCGDNPLMPQYRAIRKAGAKAVVFVGIEPEGAVLVRKIGGLPRASGAPLSAAGAWPGAISPR